jgi:hypothetical protein
MRTLSLVARSLAALVLFAQAAEAQSVKLAWEPNPESDVTGYTIVYGTTSRAYTSSVPVGNTTRWTVEGLTVGETYYFAIVAHTRRGVTSPLSSELSTVVQKNTTSRSRLLWRNATTGELSTWVLEGNTLLRSEAIAAATVPTFEWRVVGMGDFNADAEQDVVWQHSAGQIAVWLAKGTTGTWTEIPQPAQVPLDPLWRAMAVGDMNQDGSPDLLWQHAKKGWLSVWYMKGQSFVSATPLVPGELDDLEWQIAGTGEFNKDGKTDLLFRHATSDSLAVWLMDGVKQTQAQPLTPASLSDPGWKIRAVVDVNNDGGADILLHHDDGRVALWVMDGLTLPGGQAQALDPPGIEDSNWRMVAGAASAGSERAASTASGQLSAPQSGAKTGGTAVSGLEQVGGQTQVQTQPKKDSAPTETTDVEVSRRKGKR